MEIEQAKNIIDQSIISKDLIIMIGQCRVNYCGRAGSTLKEGQRLLILKGDGAFMVHQKDKLAPVNYQKPGTIISTDIKNGELVVTGKHRKTKEVIEVYFEDIHFVNSFCLHDSHDISVTGMEKHLSKLLMQDLEVIEKGLKPLKKESHNIRGSIDIYAVDKNDIPVVIEVKRRQADFNAVMQLKRYVDEVSKQQVKKVRGILCAPSISKNAMKFLEDSNIEFCKIDFETTFSESKIKGLQSKQHTLNRF